MATPRGKVKAQQWRSGEVVVRRRDCCCRSPAATMAEGAKEGGDEGFSFVDKVRLMMYTEQEKEAFLIDKKEKEEKKKAKKLAKAAAGENSKSEKQTLLSQVKSFFVGETPKEAPKATPEEITPPTTPDPSAASTNVKD